MDMNENNREEEKTLHKLLKIIQPFHYEEKQSTGFACDRFYHFKF